MSWDGFGVFSRDYNWVNDRDSAIDITASRMDAEDDNFAAGIQACLAKNGENTATANLPMGTYKHTNVGASAARTDYARVAELVDNKHCAIDAGGVADAQTLTLTPALTAYVKYQRFSFIPVANNTGACTLAVVSGSAKDIKLMDGTDPKADDLSASAIAEVIYDGTNFILLNPATLTDVTLINPALGTPASGVLTNCTGTAAGLNIGGNAATATTAASCTGNSATATTAASCTGNSATATTAASCTGNSYSASALVNIDTDNVSGGTSAALEGMDATYGIYRLYASDLRRSGSAGTLYCIGRSGGGDVGAQAALFTLGTLTTTPTFFELTFQGNPAATYYKKIFLMTGYDGYGTAVLSSLVDISYTGAIDGLRFYTTGNGPFSGTFKLNAAAR